MDTINDGDKVNALQNSVKNLVAFIEKGGEVDFVVPDEVAADETKEELFTGSKA